MNAKVLLKNKNIASYWRGIVSERFQLATGYHPNIQIPFINFIKNSDNTYYLQVSRIHDEKLQKRIEKFLTKIPAEHKIEIKPKI